MNKRILFLFSGIIGLSFIISFYFYPQLPEKMASHWNVKGETDVYIPKFWGVFGMPFFLVGLTFLFITIPKIDPLKANIEKFSKYYNGFIVLFLFFMLFIHLQIILWNVGIKMNPNLILPIGIGLLFFYMGILCENAKRNWFIGIRTPWTLSSEVVWNRTHKIGGRLFKITGIFAFLGILFKNYTLFFILIPPILASFYLIVYSYLQYKKCKN